MQHFGVEFGALGALLGVLGPIEDVLLDLHTVENTLVVGVNTGGCSLVPDNFTCYLPNTGLPIFFGTGLGFYETMENRDTVGYAPDLWVNPPDAMGGGGPDV